MPDRFFDDKVTFMIWYVLCCKPEHTVRNAAFDNVIPRFFDSNTVPSRQNCLITALRAADQAVHPLVTIYSRVTQRLKALSLVNKGLKPHFYKWRVIDRILLSCLTLHPKEFKGLSHIQPLAGRPASNTIYCHSLQLHPCSHIGYLRINLLLQWTAPPCHILSRHIEAAADLNDPQMNVVVYYTVITDLHSSTRVRARSGSRGLSTLYPGWGAVFTFQAMTPVLASRYEHKILH